MYLLGLDVGTTACKAVVFDIHGAIRGSAYHEYPVQTDATGRAEQDAEAVWEHLKSVIAAALAAAGSADIKAIGLSVQGDAVIPVDEHIRPVHNAVLGMDYRSEPQARRCAELLGDRELFRMTGMRPHPMNTLTKILWLKENASGAYARTRRMTTYADFIMGRLGGEPIIDYSMASRTMAFDLKGRRWSERILSAVDVDPGLLSPAVPCGRAIGVIRPEVAAELGMTSGALLVTGGHDQVCAAVGAGVISEGLGVVSTGTAEVMSTAFGRPRLDEGVYRGYYPCYHYAKKDMYFTFSLNHVGGILLQWYRDNFAGPEEAEAERTGENVFKIIDREAAEAGGDLLVLPHFNGSGTPLCDMSSRGAIVGLSLSTTRHDIARAILECQSFELRTNLEAMADAGIRVDELVAVGGGASSPLWLQIKADVLARPISTLKVKEGACLGAALLAGTASGVYEDLDQAVDRCVSRDRIYQPDADAAGRYDEKHALYRRLYPALAGLNRRMAG